MQKLYTYRVEHRGDIIMASHVVADDAAHARQRVHGQYQLTHSANYLATMRQQGDIGIKLAEMSAQAPLIEDCEIIVRRSKANNPEDHV
jgi:hypothetical protein